MGRLLKNSFEKEKKKKAEYKLIQRPVGKIDY